MRRGHDASLLRSIMGELGPAFWEGCDSIAPHFDQTALDQEVSSMAGLLAALRSRGPIQERAVQGCVH